MWTYKNDISLENKFLITPEWETTIDIHYTEQYTAQYGKGYEVNNDDIIVHYFLR